MQNDKVCETLSSAQLESIFYLAVSSGDENTEASNSDSMSQHPKKTEMNQIKEVLPASLVNDILSTFSVIPQRSALAAIFYWAGIKFLEELNFGQTNEQIFTAWTSTLRQIYRDSSLNLWNKYENAPQLVDFCREVVQAQLIIDESDDLEGSKELGQFLKTLLVPVLITKSIAFYFGLKYSEFPGEGYGWGLVISLGLTAATFVKFAYDRRSTKRQK